MSKFNREWNIVVEHPGLASSTRSTSSGTWSRPRSSRRRCEEREASPPLPDLLVPEAPEERAITRFFKPKVFTYTKDRPLRIQPVLTPDNYAQVVLEHIKSATKSIYFQNQYINVNKENSGPFDALLDALLARIAAGLDVHIILRNLPGARQMLEALQLRGFDASKIRLQGTCHNKGIIVDSRAVALGSHNWSSDGTTTEPRRDPDHPRPGGRRVLRAGLPARLGQPGEAADPRRETMPVVQRPGRTPRRDAGVATIPWSDYFED